MSDYARKPFLDDLMASTWPSDPFTEDELTRAESIGWDRHLLTTARAAPGARAAVRQEFARRDVLAGGNA
jgi:hypothetical protein